MRRGVTLVEMLVVLIILAIILGMTISILQGSGRDLGVQASANAVSSLLRQASTHARIEGRTMTIVDPEVVYERCYALSRLENIEENQDWDNLF